MDKKNKTYLAHIDEAAAVQPETGPGLTFIKFQCPFCSEINVKAKGNLANVVLCSNLSCRRFIIIKDFKSFKDSKDSKDSKKSA